MAELVARVDVEGWGRVREVTYDDRFRPPLIRVIRSHLFELAVAVVFTLAGVAYLRGGGVALRSPVGRDVGVFSTVWAVFYIVGGPLTILGVLRLNLRVRVAGLALLTSGLLMTGVAALWGHPEDPRWANYFIFAAACGTRAVLCGRAAGR